jgi:hypothetical protein
MVTAGGSIQTMGRSTLHEDVVTKAFFKISIHCIVGNDQSTLFWMDPWVDGGYIVNLAPELVAVVHPWQ